MNRGVGDAEYFRTWYLDRDWRFYRMFLADIVQHAARPGPILDVGAGLGYFVEAAQQWGLSCDGLEGSPEAVEMALKRFPGLHIRHHPLSERFPFDDGSFGVAFFNQVIEHLEPETGRRTIEEIYRVLRPGGMLLLFSPSRYNEHERREDPTHIHMYTPTELQGLLRSAGFDRLAPLDEPLTLLGTSGFGRKIMNRLFKMAPWDRLSASANVRAFKPDANNTR